MIAIPLDNLRKSDEYGEDSAHYCDSTAVRMAVLRL